MHALRLFARFEEIPSQQEQQAVIDELINFLRQIAPEGEVKVSSGQGSWWVDVYLTSAVAFAVWLSTETASWLVNKGLDHFASKHPSKDSAPNLLGHDTSEVSNVALVRGLNNLNIDSRKLAAMANLATQLNTMTNTKVTLRISEKTGDIVNTVLVKATEGQTEFEFFQSSSPENFNSPPL